MKKTLALILALMFSVMIFCGCNGTTGNDMSENGTVEDSDGFIEEEDKDGNNSAEGNQDNDDKNRPTLEMPSMSMPTVTMPDSSENHRGTENTTETLDSVL